MSDFVTPFNQSSDFQTPSSNNETPVGVNEFPNVIYKTPFNSTMCILSIVFFIFGMTPTCALTIYFIYINKPFLIFICFFLLLIAAIGFFLGSYFSLYFIISFDINAGMVVLKSRKIFFCFNKTNTILIRDIREVAVETDKSVAYESNGIQHYSFKVIFRLLNGKEYIGCAGIEDYKNSGRNAFDIIRKALPQNVQVTANLESNISNMYSYY